MNAQDVTVKCSRCGGALEFTPDSIFMLCPYCGNVNWSSEDVKTQIFVVRSTPRDRVLDTFWNRMKSDPDMAKLAGELEVVETQGIYVPIYSANIEANATWSGIETRMVGTGKHARIERIHREGDHHETMALAIPARRVAEEFGLEELIEKVRGVTPERVKLDEVNWEEVKLSALSPELSTQDAADKLRDETEDTVRYRIRGRNNLSELTFYSCNSDIKATALTLVPLWVITYRYQGGIYNIAFSGSDLAPLRATEPMFMGQRVMSIAGSAVAVIIGAGILTAFLASSGEIILALIGIACFGGAYYLSSRAISDVRVERWK
ncbi:MAG TPA: hypothetical protein HA257_04080 [Candidatus Methanoperedenaceae archaeon]|nr:hypothetical protein [Candidatus Methanoperedenaceae archaeon]